MLEKERNVLFFLYMGVGDDIRVRESDDKSSCWLPLELEEEKFQNLVFIFVEN